MSDEHEDRLEKLEEVVFGTGRKNDDGVIPRIVSLERDRNLLRWVIAGIFGFGFAVIENWLGNLRMPWQGPPS